MTQKYNIDDATRTYSGASRRGFLGCLGLSPGVAGLLGAGLLGVLQVPSALADLTPINERGTPPPRIYHSARRSHFPAGFSDGPRPCPTATRTCIPNASQVTARVCRTTILARSTLNAYAAFIKALNTGSASRFEAIPLGGTAKLANPQAAYSFSMEGADAQAPAMPTPPAFSSAQMAAEIAEDYWSALTRDVPFSQYATDPRINQAAADLSKFSDYRGPKVNGQVTPDVIFRGNTPGELTGPYISQFLLKATPMGAATLPQLYRTSVSGNDYLTSYADWLKAQRGGASGSNVFDPTPRYIRNNRDLSQYLLVDFMGQANIQAALILLSYGTAAVSPTNPYLHSSTQSGGVTFGSQQQLDLVMPRAEPGFARDILSKMVSASQAAAGNIRGKDSQSCNRSGQLSDPFRHSEFRSAESSLQRLRHLFSADGIPGGFTLTSVLSGGACRDCGGWRHHAQGAL